MTKGCAEESLTGGIEFCVGDLPTHGDTAKVGPMICFDREFPESARILMLKGAEVILTPSAGDLVDEEERSATYALLNFGPELLRTGRGCIINTSGFRF